MDVVDRTKDAWLPRKEDWASGEAGRPSMAFVPEALGAAALDAAAERLEATRVCANIVVTE